MPGSGVADAMNLATCIFDVSERVEHHSDTTNVISGRAA